MRPILPRALMVILLAVAPCAAVAEGLSVMADIGGEPAGQSAGVDGPAGTPSEEAAQAEADMMTALRTGGLDRRLWKPAAPLRIIRWGGVDRLHRIQIVQARPNPDGSWAVERVQATHPRGLKTPVVTVRRATLSASLSRSLDTLLLDPQLGAAPAAPPPNSDFTWICLDGDYVVLQLRLPSRAVTALQHCAADDPVEQTWDLIAQAFPTEE